MNHVKTIALITLIALLGISAQAYSLDYSGNGYKFIANSNSPDPYIRGVANGTLTTIMSSLHYEGIICTPDNIKREDVDKVVNQFLIGNPGRMHEQIYVLGTDALMLAFPCDDGVAAQ